MIRHAVFFAFKTGVSNTACEQHIGDFAKLPGEISEIAQYEWGTVIAGPDAKQGREFHVAHYLLFDDTEALQTYIEHPAHQTFIDRNRSSWAGVKVVDSEIEA